MYQNNFLLLSISFFVVFLITSAYAGNLYEDCSPPVNSSCGFVANITYPFWDSRLPDDCGHPSFKVHCDNATLSINIEKETYYIHNINYVANVFTITKPLFLNGPCPLSKSLLTNTTINSNPFGLSSDSQIATLFYNCSRPPRSVPDPPYGFRCSIKGSYVRPSTLSPSFKSDVGYLAVKDKSWEQELRKNCSFEVDLPILTTEAVKIASGESNIDNVLNKGFEVKWKIDDGKCDDCKKLKGRCGFSRSLNQTTCFCKNGVHDPICYGPRNNTHAPTDQNYTVCAPQSCGNLSSISNPFWIPTKQESYCGHPSFKISCKNNTTPILRVSNDDYVITHVDYINHTFQLVDDLVYDDSITCPTPLNNLTLEHTPFSFSTNSADFFLFYNCSNLPKEYYVYCPISCKAGEGNRNATYKSFGDFHFEDLVEQNYSLGLCESVVAVPVDLDMDMDPGNHGYGASSYWKMNYRQILGQGFTLKRTLHDCSVCETSGGRCGLINDKSVCFCRDETLYKTCHDDAGQKDSAPTESYKTAVIIGTGIAACVLLSSTLCFFLYRRHRKKESSAQFLNNKSYSTSTAPSNFHILNGSTVFGVRVFNYRELEEATEYFNPLKELGEGGFGTVYYGKLRDGREVAIKRLYENNNKRTEQFLNEIEILANLRHENLVNLYGCTSRQSRELLLVYEYVSNGTVADHLHGKQSKQGLLPWARRLSIATETASALVYLHDSDVVHRDVKTQNILLDSNFSVKVADFGLSRLFPLDVTHVSTAPQGTPGYVDPEYHQCYQLTEKSDVYSFGVMLAELLSSLPAVDITRRRNEINLATMAINKIRNCLDEFVDPSLGFQSDCQAKMEITAVAELAFQCLQSTKEMRPSMNEVLKRLLTIQDQQGSEVDSAEVVDIPADDVLMLKGDMSPISPPREDNFVARYKPNASV